MAFLTQHLGSLDLAWPQIAALFALSLFAFEAALLWAFVPARQRAARPAPASRR